MNIQISSVIVFFFSFQSYVASKDIIKRLAWLLLAHPNIGCSLHGIDVVHSFERLANENITHPDYLIAQTVTQ